MVYAYQIYDTLVSICRKDKRGLSLSIDDFNYMVVQVNQRIFRLNYSRFESSKLSMDEIDSLKVVDKDITLNASGIGVLPTDYYHLVGDPYYIHPTSGRRKVELVTSLEHDNREMDFLTKSSALYPVVFMGYGATSEDMSLYVRPVTDMANKTIYVSYIRQVATPYLDYYINDSTLEVTYLPESSTAITLPSGYTAPPVSKNGQTLRNTTTGLNNITSYTTNFEWHEHDIPQIINIFIGLLGIQLEGQDLVQISSAYEPIIEKE